MIRFMMRLKVVINKKEIALAQDLDKKRIRFNSDQNIQDISEE